MNPVEIAVTLGLGLGVTAFCWLLDWIKDR